MLLIRDSKAFSLIELLVVVAIVGLLAAIALPTYKQYATRVKLEKAVLAMDDIFDKQKQYWATKGNFPGPAELAKMYGTTASGNNFVGRINPYISNVYTYAGGSGSPCYSTAATSLALDMTALGIDPSIATSGNINCYIFNVSGVLHQACNYALQESGGNYATGNYIPQWYGCKDVTCSNPNTYYQVKDGYGGKLGFTSANCIN
jgi:prepilin-type N-terminal cleavage/methylation domain-containing protein